jgi:hypothetical protein
MDSAYMVDGVRTSHRHADLQGCPGHHSGIPVPQDEIRRDCEDTCRHTNRVCCKDRVGEGVVRVRNEGLSRVGGIGGSRSGWVRRGYSGGRSCHWGVWLLFTGLE